MEKNIDTILHFEKNYNKYKNVILLFYVLGYNLKETAVILKISEAAVKMRLARARQALKLEMEN